MIREDQLSPIQINGEQLQKPSHIQQQIKKMKRQHPDSVVVFFTKHKSANQSVPKPTKPLMLFKRSLKIQEVFYALYNQIQTKNLAFYVLKPQSNNRISYFHLQPGKTLGQIYDEFSYNNYLALLYNVGLVKKKGFLAQWQRKVLRIIFIAGLIYFMVTMFEKGQNVFGSKDQN